MMQAQEKEIILEMYYMAKSNLSYADRRKLKSLSYFGI